MTLSVFQTERIVFKVHNAMLILETELNSKGDEKRQTHQSTGF